MSEKAKVRLFVEHPLGAGQSVPLDRDQAHYLFGVMRLKTGARVALFNGRDGEWQAGVTEAGKRGGSLICEAQSAPQVMPPDLWLLFAPIKKARTDFTNSERIRQDRLQAHAVEAAEQCGGVFVPEVSGLTSLSAILDDWPTGRQLMFCDEALVGGASALSGARAGAPWAILIGPEGGVSEAERARLRGLEFAHPVALGPRILRADTAAVAAMTLWQQALGDWS